MAVASWGICITAFVAASVFLQGCHKRDIEAKTFRVAYIASSYYPYNQTLQRNAIAPWGVNSKHAVLMAVEEMNAGLSAQGFLIDLPQALIFEANGTAGANLTDFVKNAVDAGVVAIWGADWGRVAASVISTLNSLNSSVPLISAGITGANFGNATAYPHLVRTTYSDSEGIQALMRNLQARAVAASTSPNDWAVLYSTDIYGAAGFPIVEDVAKQDSVIQQIGFASGSNVYEVRNDVRKLLSASAFQGRQPMVLISATGPDTTTAMHALAAENVQGPPTGDWVVGAIEAPESVIKSISDSEVAVGYNSYLTTTPSSCAAMDGFNARFQKRYQTAPTGGFAVASYDMVVLTAAALRAALATGTGKRSDLALIAAIRHKDFGVQGLGGPLVFQENENQPCGPPLSLLQLLPGYPIRHAAVGVANSVNSCPRLPVGSQVTFEQSGCLRPEQPSVIQMTCPAKVQNKNTCIAKGSQLESIHV